MTAEIIAKVLGGRKTGATWMAPCPAHDDHEPSLSVRDGRDGRVLVRCHAGCSQQEVIEALRARGLWGCDHPTILRTKRHDRAAVADTPDTDGGRRTEAALAIWRAAAPASASPVGAYLRSRGLSVAIPTSLLFHAALKHPSGGTWPAMIALVTRGTDATPIGIHRTFLARDGGGKAPVKPAKMMLGPCRDGVVRLGEATTSVAIGEGIETCLSVMQATGRPAWAALSTSGLRSLELPAAITEVIILADGDEPGETAARHAARQWAREGRSVRIARAPAGQDFNDVLRTSKELVR
jgi:hypothetical protein